MHSIQSTCVKNVTNRQLAHIHKLRVNDTHLVMVRWVNNQLTT